MCVCPCVYACAYVRVLVCVCVCMRAHKSEMYTYGGGQCQSLTLWHRISNSEITRRNHSR